MRLSHRYPRAAVATPHYLASAAGAATLADGGNAVDAIIAANLALGVVAPYFCGYGGDLFAIVWDGSATGYLGSGRSPTSATIERIRERAGGAVMPAFGPDAVTVPGGVAGWFALLERWGTREFGQLTEFALRYATEGFEITPGAAQAISEGQAFYRGFPHWQAVYGGVHLGDVLRQPALAKTIELLASDGPDAYYRGPIGAAIATAVQEHGGELSAADLAAHSGEWTEPLRAPFRDVEVLELPPPTQGVTVLEALRILDQFDAAPSGPDREHLLIEATKLALADRDRWVSDPDTMPHPASDLLSDPWVRTRADAIDADRAGTPDPGEPQAGGTAYLCATDADGLMVSLIQSNFVHFGSGVHVSEWGINLNNRGFSFSLDPERVNVFAGGKRPMHTLIPAMALRDGIPCLVFGSMGGDAQAPVHVQVLAHVLDDGADPADAIAAPRWRVDPGTWAVRAETRFDAVTLATLRARGHDITETSAFDSGMGHSHAIWPTAGGWGATFDPRSEGAALGC
ncbi:MAG: gamma-glutamyltransferase family protein [Acidimicrobiia bacterium]|nr:gamma-glutamyltransferase family protein [Acidimicrobiia bacterium]